MNSSRLYLIFTFLLSFQLLFAQNGTIKVKKPVPPCNIKLVADTGLINKTMRLSAFAFAGISKRDVDKFRNQLPDTVYRRGALVRIAIENFSSDCRSICDTKKYQLVKIKVRPEEDYPGLVLIEFHFIRKPRKGLFSK